MGGGVKLLIIPYPCWRIGDSTDFKFQKFPLCYTYENGGIRDFALIIRVHSKGNRTIIIRRDQFTHSRDHQRAIVKIYENFHFAENHHSFRHQSGTKLKVDHFKTEIYGKQPVSYFGPNIRNSIPQEIKNVTTLAAFKTKIKR